MSRIQECKELFKNIKEAWDRNQQTALVMLIDVKGSAYRLPGAKMMMAKDGQMVGTISGGCLESDLYGWAEKAMDMKTPLIQTYNLSENDIWSLGIGCKGILDILILPIEQNDDFWEKADEIIQKDQSFSLLLELPTGKQVLIDKDGRIIGRTDGVPIEVIEKAKKSVETQTRAEIIFCKGKRYLIDAVKTGEHLIVAGAGRDAIPVVELAAKVGFTVTVLDSRKNFNSPRFFPTASHLIRNPVDIHPDEVTNSWWVVMNHHQKQDESALQLALNSNPRFVGVLGPMTRTEEMLSNIGKGFSSGPIRSPLGLDLGAETMEEVAVSIVSELMAVRNVRNPIPLHGKAKIHA